MAKTKKRLSKKAKEALKIVEDSKLLANSKMIKATNADQAFESAESPLKTSGAHKNRPNKKRG